MVEGAVYGEVFRACTVVAIPYKVYALRDDYETLERAETAGSASAAGSGAGSGSGAAATTPNMLLRRAEVALRLSSPDTHAALSASGHELWVYKLSTPETAANMSVSAGSTTDQADAAAAGANRSTADTGSNAGSRQESPLNGLLSDPASIDPLLTTVAQGVFLPPFTAPAQATPDSALSAVSAIIPHSVDQGRHGPLLRAVELACLDALLRAGETDQYEAFGPHAVLSVGDGAVMRVVPRLFHDGQLVVRVTRQRSRFVPLPVPGHLTRSQQFGFQSSAQMAWLLPHGMPCRIFGALGLTSHESLFEPVNKPLARALHALLTVHFVTNIKLSELEHSPWIRVTTSDASAEVLWPAVLVVAPALASNAPALTLGDTSGGRSTALPGGGGRGGSDASNVRGDMILNSMIGNPPYEMLAQAMVAVRQQAATPALEPPVLETPLLHQTVHPPLAPPPSPRPQGAAFPNTPGASGSTARHASPLQYQHQHQHQHLLVNRSDQRASSLGAASAAAVGGAGTGSGGVVGAGVGTGVGAGSGTGVAVGAGAGAGAEEGGAAGLTAGNEHHPLRASSIYPTPAYQTPSVVATPALADEWMDASFADDEVGDADFNFFDLPVSEDAHSSQQRHAHFDDDQLLLPNSRRDRDGALPSDPGQADTVSLDIPKRESLPNEYKPELDAALSNLPDDGESLAKAAIDDAGSEQDLLVKGSDLGDKWSARTRFGRLDLRSAGLDSKYADGGRFFVPMPKEEDRRDDDDDDDDDDEDNDLDEDSDNHYNYDENENESRHRSESSYLDRGSDLADDLPRPDNSSGASRKRPRHFRVELAIDSDKYSSSEDSSDTDGFDQTMDESGNESMDDLNVGPTHRPASSTISLEEAQRGWIQSLGPTDSLPVPVDTAKVANFRQLVPQIVWDMGGLSELYDFPMVAGRTFVAPAHAIARIKRVFPHLEPMPISPTKRLQFLSPPLVTFARGGDPIKARVAVLRFWRLLGLEPPHRPEDAKGDITIVLLTLDAPVAVKATRRFLDQLQQTYEACGLGSVTLPTIGDSMTRGLVAINADLKHTSDEAVGDLFQTACMQLKHQLESALPESANLLVAMIYPPTSIRGGSFLVGVPYQLAMGFSAVQEAFPGSRWLLSSLDRLVARFHYDDMMPTMNVYVRLSLVVYSRFSSFPRAFQLASLAPQSVGLQFTPELPPYLMEDELVMHVTYLVVNERWVVVAWSDQWARVTRADVFRLADASERALYAVCSEMWRRSVALMQSASARPGWRLTVAKCGTMHMVEPAIWHRVAKADPDSATVLILMDLPHPRGLIVNDGRSIKAEAPAPPPAPVDDFVVVDEDDETYGVAINASHEGLGLAAPAAALGYLMQPMASGHLVLEVRLIAQHGITAGSQTLVNRVLGQFRRLASLSEFTGVTTESTMLPWHVVAVAKLEAAAVKLSL